MQLVSGRAVDDRVRNRYVVSLTRPRSLIPAASIIA
jgi:hypothetical protein